MKMDPSTLPDWRLSPELKTAREQLAALESQLPALDAAVSSARAKMQRQAEQTEAVELQSLIQKANAKQVQAARAALEERRRELALAMAAADQTREDLARLRPRMTELEATAKDAALAELQQAYRAAAEDLGRALDVAAGAQERLSAARDAMFYQFAEVTGSGARRSTHRGFSPYALHGGGIFEKHLWRSRGSMSALARYQQYLQEKGWSAAD